MNPPLLTIGRFAQLTGLSVRALRLYEERGLLRPQAVDAGSGYRLYATAQLEGGALIAQLRRVDMPLEEIKGFLQGQDADRQRALTGHRVRLGDRAAAATEAIRALDEMMKGLSMPTEQRERGHKLSSMVVKTLRDQAVLRIQWVLSEDDCDPGRNIADVFATLQRQRLTQAGPPYWSCAEPDDDGVRHVEVGIPVNKPGAAEGRVEPAVLPGGDVAAIFYRGPYQGIEAAYRELWAEMEAAGMTPSGDPRDVYLTSPQATPDPEDYFTEVVWPIKG
jgi:DNA-binding transcriptional MerR regulator